MSPYGFKDPQEGIDSNLELYDFLLKNGIFPLPTSMKITPGSVFEKRKLEMPSTFTAEYILTIDAGLHKLRQKHRIPLPKLHVEHA